MSLLTGARTEELRALDWVHVNLDARTAYVEVWRSVREGGDTKTKKSKRTLAVPELCIEAPCAGSGLSRLRNAWPLVIGGSTQAWCSPQRLERRWMPRMFAVTFVGHSAWCPGWH
jgi:integrase